MNTASVGPRERRRLAAQRRRVRRRRLVTACVGALVLAIMIVVSSILFEYTGVNVALALAALACGALAIRALRRFGDFLMRGRKGNR